MNWLSGLSQSDKDEMYHDSCDAFAAKSISEAEFRLALGKLGYNATDIEEEVRLNAPE